MPPELEAPARSVLPWARRYAARQASIHGIARADVWAEACSALIRAQVFFKPGHGTFHSYARTAIARGVWRYSVRAGTRPEVSLQSVGDPGHAGHGTRGGHAALPTEPSAETVVMWAELAAWGHAGTRDAGDTGHGGDTTLPRAAGTRRRDTAGRR